MLFISEAIAQSNEAQVPQEPGTMANLLPLLLIFFIFYMFIIRPKQKEIKQHSNMIEATKKGDEIVTGGGIVGKVRKVEDTILEVEIAADTVVKVMRNTITRNNSAIERAKKDLAKQEPKKK
ncbi:MAG: preprotein translocase subunit YajC [Rickettsiales bacterium]|nr:preprotein translocase subunit YajC [Pseudomonadota bacterium]MDA0965542.1 preprotein translocase subunit YajC [Pseudomonadota bacterium]MDG4542866.1 preprotein translocase subunit YajC [Rickettsiales bacterium]MDG4544686.1 preprotein translocase subunit YajC [Rickettsiales bacterium]MDG4546808.1 preprotein translocase subunit YajC [Rickettsiales bacterium]